MAGGVNIKMGVSGVNEVKRHMKDVQNSAKTLDAALALNEKQFKATGDSETYMSTKTELLNTKIEQQKSIIHDAETALKQMTDNGVDKASKAFQDMQQQLIKAKGELVDAETAMANISNSADTASVNAGNMSRELQQIGQGVSYQNITDGLDKITTGLGNIIKKAWQAGEALVTATLGAGSWADELKTTSEQYSTPEWEITPEDLQRMRKTSAIIDTDVESIIASRKKLLKGMGGEDKDVFAFLHDNNIATEGRKAEDVFWDVGEAIMAMTNDADQEAAAQKAFGKSWSDLKPLFNAGRESYEEMNKSWNVVTNDQVDNLGKMDDSYQKMQSEWETFQMQVLEAFSGPMTETLNTISGLLGEVNKYLQTPQGKEMLKQMGDTISGLIKDLTEIDPETVVSGLKSVIDGIKGALEWISNPDNQQLVIGGLKAILAGWAGLKLTGGALTVLKLVEGIKSLKGGGSGGAETAAASGGGSWFTGAFNNINGKALNLSAAGSVTGLTNAGVVADWFTNNTSIGRYLSNRISELFGGEGHFAEEKPFQDIEDNLETFADNWDPNSENANVLAKLFGSRDANQDAAERTGTEDWRPSYMQGYGSNYYNPNMPIIEAADKMEEAADTLVGNTSGTSSTEDGSGNVLTGIPAVIAAALKGWKIVMNGELVAALVAPQVNALIGEGILNP